MADADVKTFSLGDFALQSGETIPGAFLAYKTFGAPSSPAVIYPTWYSGAIADNEWLVGAGKTLDPARYYIIMPALFGNGQSSSAQQHGGGSARTSLHNQVFLEGVKSALLAAKGTSSGGVCAGEACEASEHGEYRGWTDEERANGLRALGRVYAGWGFSQAFYRERVYETAPTLGFKGLEEFMVGFWEAWALSKGAYPENMLVMLHTWQAGDCSDQEPYNKETDFELAMRSIKAKMLVLPGQTDLYFPPEDSEYEVKCMSPGIGTAGGPGQSTEDVKWLDEKLRVFFGDGGSDADTEAMTERLSTL
ncbi:homoserine acetyltransferase family protein [Verticillium alfalfae VaMs.102]|uniref:Homoserine acetyltransferase family protein n=1 Tax=Verticillium alfalfae (strain VaMs.102 / ATCC MYA-4576 / FGSC 10136) TaxID=526221 RepID=C9SI78_VERA1|nr:homoserine acetyltransferase family protein [Verticillium alfalfae VaMs.102]EEY18651.1 homoserine acetyltransferase family protein [Verticillium alfalfae VaMs.102]